MARTTLPKSVVRIISPIEGLAEKAATSDDRIIRWSLAALGIDALRVDPVKLLCCNLALGEIGSC